MPVDEQRFQEVFGVPFVLGEDKQSIVDLVLLRLLVKILAYCDARETMVAEQRMSRENSRENFLGLERAKEILAGSIWSLERSLQEAKSLAASLGFETFPEGSGERGVGLLQSRIHERIKRAEDGLRELAATAEALFPERVRR